MKEGKGRHKDGKRVGKRWETGRIGGSRFFALYVAVAVSHFADGPFDGEGEIGAGGFGADLAVAVSQGGIDDNEVTLAFADAGAYLYLLAVGVDGVTVAEVHVGGHASGLDFAGHYPTAYLVQE